MLTLKGEKLYLRALEPEDLEFLHELENNEEFWEVSATQAPFSKYILKKYLENSHLLILFFYKCYILHVVLVLL